MTTQKSLKGPSKWTALGCTAGSEKSVSSNRNRAQHLLADLFVLLGFRATGGQSNVEQFLNGLDVVHAQALKLLRRQVFVNVLAVIGGQNNVRHARAFCRQGFLLDAADGKHVAAQRDRQSTRLNS